MFKDRGKMDFLKKEIFHLPLWHTENVGQDLKFVKKDYAKKCVDSFSHFTVYLNISIESYTVIA